MRRVPLGWEHPVEYNPYWFSQSQPFLGKVKPPSLLRGQKERFVGLMSDFPDAYARWEEELREMTAREGHGWTFAIEYHLTGYQGRKDSEPVVHPWYGYGPDGNTETQATVRDEDHLHELCLERVQSEKPDPANYMPVWDDADDLGWCLYETVSEGTPVTPVFATPEELIDHLATVGQDWDQVPLRREAAETLVRNGSSFGSMIVTGGRVLNSTTDADLIADALGGKS